MSNQPVLAFVMTHPRRAADADLDDPYPDWIEGWGRVVTIDYEAALRLHRESRLPIISGARCDDEMRAVKMLVDAALGQGKGDDIFRCEMVDEGQVIRVSRIGHAPVLYNKDMLIVGENTQ